MALLESQRPFLDEPNRLLRPKSSLPPIPLTGGDPLCQQLDGQQAARSPGFSVEVAVL